MEKRGSRLSCAFERAASRIMRSSSVRHSSSRNGTSHWKFTGAGLSLVCGRTLMAIPFASNHLHQRVGRRLVLCRLAFKLFVGDDLDAETGQTLVVVRRRGEVPDRGDAEVAQDLRADADLAPLLVAVSLGRFLLSNGCHRDARSAVAQIYQHAAAGFAKMLKRYMHALIAEENILDDIGLVEPGQHVLAVADALVDERDVVDRIERRAVGVTLQRPDRAFRGERRV